MRAQESSGRTKVKILLAAVVRIAIVCTIVDDFFFIVVAGTGHVDAVDDSQLQRAVRRFGEGNWNRVKFYVCENLRL